MLATQLCSRTVSVSGRCLQQLLFSSPRCLCPSAAAARQLCTSRSSCRATGTAGQQSIDDQVAAADTSVLDTVKLLEAGIGPLSQHPMVPPPQPRVVVISGPSGVGKDAVIKRLQELRPDLYFVVTATSRAMRPGEVEGKDYFFVSKATFESWIASGQLLEHALVYGEYKGIPRQQVDAALSKGSDVVLRIDVQHALVYGEYKGIPRQQVDAALSRGSDVVLRIDVQVSARVVYAIYMGQECCGGAFVWAGNAGGRVFVEACGQCFGWCAEDALVYGEYKGIPRQQVDAALSKGSDVVLRIDVQHALVYSEYKGIPRQQVDAALSKGSDVVLRIDVQHALVYGEYKGIPRQQVDAALSKGSDVVLRIDVQHALVYGEYKGIPRQQVDAALSKGSDVVLRIDVQGADTVRRLMPGVGADTVRRLMPGVVSVFIVAESEAQLVARLVSRKTEPLDKMVTRVKTARDETQHIHKFDYVVVNREGQLDECVAQLAAIIDAEKLRTKQQQG
uniref:Guanylate kinase-like domain-containing protein n=1 Tax=Tetradesmus obliquus TaxID=3088 RepID=A0A383W3Y2_TETOB|eukprot:jgi/Sobl393_1/17292/SZX72181.1